MPHILSLVVQAKRNARYDLDSTEPDLKLIPTCSIKLDVNYIPFLNLAVILPTFVRRKQSRNRSVLFASMIELLSDHDPHTQRYYDTHPFAIDDFREWCNAGKSQIEIHCYILLYAYGF